MYKSYKLPRVTFTASINMNDGEDVLVTARIEPAQNGGQTDPSWPAYVDEIEEVYIDGIGENIVDSLSKQDYDYLIEQATEKMYEPDY